MTTSLLDEADDNQLDPNKNYLEELVGEDKKFKSVDDLAKGKFMSDLHIRILEQRLDETREEYKRAAEQAKAAEKLQDLLTRLESRDDLSSREPPLSNEDTKTALDPAQLDTLISERFQKLKTSEKEEQNFNLVMEKVKDKYGAGYSQTLREQAKELDYSVEEVDALARRNPKAFFRTFGIDGERGNEFFQAPPESNTRSSTFAPKVVKRTMSYYQNLKKSNPNLYLDPKIAVQMDKDALALGDAFFDS